MTNESVAAHLGTAVRTVATWHQKPDRVPSAEIQQALDTTLERAGKGAQARFTRNLAGTAEDAEPASPPPDDPAHAAADTTATAADNQTATASPTITVGTAVDTADGDFMGWLQVAHAASAPPDGSDVGQIIRWYRTYEGLTQQDVAARLNTTQSRLSKLEKGTQALRDVTELQHIARKLGIPPERLEVLPDHSGDARPFASHVGDRPGPPVRHQNPARSTRRSRNGLLLTMPLHPHPHPTRRQVISDKQPLSHPDKRFPSRCGVVRYGAGSWGLGQGDGLHGPPL